MFERKVSTTNNPPLITPIPPPSPVAVFPVIVAPVISVRFWACGDVAMAPTPPAPPKMSVALLLLMVALVMTS